MSNVTPIRAARAAGSARRVNLFSTAKADPTQAELLIEKLRESLHIYDPRPAYALYGAVAANMLHGSPVWLMYVGAPGSGGTEFINTLGHVPSLIDAGSIESSAAFLSGTSAKDAAKDATGGLLAQVRRHGGIVIKDFTSILSLGAAERQKVMGVLRESYDGRWSRPVGTDGGKNLTWEGKVGFFAKCTGVIDQFTEAASALGERWIYYRLTDAGDGDKHARSAQALENNSAVSTDWRGDLKRVVKEFYQNCGLMFGQIPMQRTRKLTLVEIDRVYRMGKLTAQCRSAVVRDRVHRDVIGVGETEMAPRVTAAFGQLYLGMEAIGVREEDRWAVLAKVTFDSMPAIRRKVIEGMLGGMELEEIAHEVRVSKRSVREAIEDLEVHGVANIYHKGKDVTGIELTEHAEQEVRYVLKFKNEMT